MSNIEDITLGVNKRPPVRIYRPNILDLIPVIGIVPHLFHMSRYFRDAREGKISLPQESGIGMRFGVTVYHGISAGIILPYFLR